MNWQDHKKKLLKDPKFVKALKETEPEYKIAREIVMARINRGLTQKVLAKKLNTKQSVISRVENAQTTPSLSFLLRLAKALNLNLNLSFSPS